MHPSTKALKLWYFGAVVLAAGVLTYMQRSEGSAALLLLPALIAVWAGLRHIGTRFRTLSLTSGRLRYETGVVSKSTRTLEITKVQDVRVDQTVGQRLMGTGDISIETAGESSRMTMSNIDQPHAVAGLILDAARNP